MAREGRTERAGSPKAHLRTLPGSSARPALWPALEGRARLALLHGEEVPVECDHVERDRGADTHRDRDAVPQRYESGHARDEQLLGLGAGEPGREREGGRR